MINLANVRGDELSTGRDTQAYNLNDVADLRPDFGNDGVKIRPRVERRRVSDFMTSSDTRCTDQRWLHQIPNA